MTKTKSLAARRFELMAAEYLERMGARIRERREELGLTQDDVARQMPGRITHNRISLWERGKNRPRDDALEALGRVLGVPVSYFMVAEPDKTETPDLAGAMSQNGTGSSQLDQIQADLAAARTERHDLVGQLEQRVRQLEQAIEHQNQNLARQSTILERIEEREQRIFKVLEDAEVIERAAADIDREPPDVRGPEPAEPLPQESEPDTGTTGRDGRQARGRRSGRA